ncbi:MAG: hypothetical protein ACLQOO_36105 [Terriglobia bacterium]
MGLPPGVLVAWLSVCALNIALDLWAVQHTGPAWALTSSTICYVLVLILLLWIVSQRTRYTSRRQAN